MGADSDEQAQAARWLGVLRDGLEEERQLARTELGLIMERLGLLADAAEAYRANVDAGVTDRRPYERLAALAHADGDFALEASTLRALADLLHPLPPELPPEAPLSPQRPTMAHAGREYRLRRHPLGFAASPPPPLLHAGEGESAAGAPPDETEAPPAPAEPPQPAVTAGTPLPQDEAGLPDSPSPAKQRMASGGGGRADDTEPTARRDLRDGVMQPGQRGRTEDDDEVQQETPWAPPRRPANGARLAQARPVSRPGRGRAALSVGVLVVAITAIVLGVRHLPDMLLPAPVPETARAAANAALVPSPSTSPIAASPSPAPVDLRLLTDAAASPSPVMAAPSPSPAPSPAPLAERCASAALRFPETRDTQAAVRAAYREFMTRQGVTIDPTSSLFTGLGEAYATRHAEVVAGWMAVALQRERRGLSAFSLTNYVASDVVVATGPSEYQLRATVSPQGWTEIRAWPADTCEGAFIQEPANAHWLDLMQTSVGDITWALPTPSPR